MLNRSRDKDFAKSCMSRKQNLSGMIGANIFNDILSAGAQAAVAGVVAVVVGFVVSVASAIIGAVSSVAVAAPTLETMLAYALTGSYSRPSLATGRVSAAIALLIIVAIVMIAWTIITIVTKMVVTPMDVGLRRFYLCIVRNNERPSVICILDGFNHFWGFAKVAIVRWFWICLGPAIIITCTAPLITIPTVGVIFGIVGVIAAVVMYYYMIVRTWPVLWIQADYPYYDGDRVFELSKQLTKGHIGDLIVYELSFLGWRILGRITGGITNLLYTAPYYSMTSAQVYAELKGSAITLAPIYQGEGDHKTLGYNPLDLTIYDHSHRPDGGDAHVSSKKPALYGVAGMYKDAKFELTPDQPMLIGRDASICAIVLSNGAEKISRKHCSVMYSSKAGKYEVIDYSSNGTYANGKRIMGNTSVVLPRGTEIMLGNASNVFRLG